MFFERYKKLCEANNLSLSAGAAKAGFNKGTVSVWKKKYENNIDVRPEPDVIQKITSYFRCDESWLLGIEKKEKPTPISESELDNELIKMLVQLTPDEAEKVAAFAAGLIAARTV